ncbi:MAG TPA: M20/M25/M40 family metallo-hydrolase [Vicinamibacterales bacterium]|nr:M20/M25/M40 family metallo-hydrolase [Vicinamibacterales bacterium]
MSRTVMAAFIWGLVATGVAAQTNQYDAAIAGIRNTDAFKQALAILDRDFDQMVADIITLTEIPAPPFKETARAKAYLDLLRAAGLTDVEQDDEGNVMGVRRGTGPSRADTPLIAVAAHLDTVFPEGTDVKVKREGTKLFAPGVGDDTRGLAVLVAMIRAMNEARIQTVSDILFLGNVGEEGLGDLRGTKFIFQKGKYKDRIKTFVSVDHAVNEANITQAAVGSRRYRVTFKGPGGHSYDAFGVVNPAFAMAGAMQKFSRLAVPEKPRTTYSVGVVGGGSSVNAIPSESWMEIDMRSEARVELQRLDERFVALVGEAVRDENSARSTTRGAITVDLKLIGDRPSGETPLDSRIVQIAAASIRVAGLTPTFIPNSTDANVPISLGIPAITLDPGGETGGSHALGEWISVERASSLRGIHILLATLLALAG